MICRARITTERNSKLTAAIAKKEVQLLRKMRELRATVTELKATVEKLRDLSKKRPPRQP
jgi:cell division protein FtsB